MSKYRILVTNDDGVASPGLRALAQAALGAGWDVVVAAPAEEASGSSAALLAVESSGVVEVEERSIEGLEDAKVYAVGASPAYIALLAMREAFGPAPMITLSGINRGANAGMVVLHSGTVGAALTAAANGGRAVAVSLDVPSVPTGRPGTSADDEGRQWDCAASFAVDVARWLAKAPIGTTLNLNVPDLPPDQIRGLRHGTLSSFGRVQMTVTEIGVGYLRMGLAEPDEAHDPNTDLALLAEHYASVTAIRGVHEASGLELPW